MTSRESQSPSRGKQVDWLIVERDYRAGIRTLRDIAADHDITEASIRKRAKRDGWPRDLQAKIQAKAEEKVRKELVRRDGTQGSRLDPITEKQVVEANAEIIASADLINRKDVQLALDVSRGQLEDLAALSDKSVRETLEWLKQTVIEAKVQDGTRPEAVMRSVEIFDYVCSLAGRVKLAKEIAAAHGVYIPMQRKILKLDEAADKNQSSTDALLAQIMASS